MSLAVHADSRNSTLRTQTTTLRIVGVDDYEPWRRFVRSQLEKRHDWLVVGEVSDGWGAVQKAQELQPDLILLDIGLPELNGIEAARQIRRCSPRTNILFLSENRCTEVVQEALDTGAGGYVLKSDAAGELLPAVETVLRGKKFVSNSLSVTRNAVDSQKAEKRRTRFRRHQPKNSTRPLAR